MKNLFNSVKLTKLQKNLFDLSHDVKLSCNMGKLVPIMALECIPGDTHKVSSEALIRFAPLVAPVMHRFDVTMHYFFVPNRIVWPNWEKFITNTKLETTDALPVFPTLFMEYDNSNHGIGSLADYLGMPYNLDTAVNQTNEMVSAIPFAAYQCIYNEYYRDQNLIPEVNYKLTDGQNDTNTDLIQLRTRAWEHDYFTACLPFAQKGEAVDIPLGNVELNPLAEGVNQAGFRLWDDHTAPADQGNLQIDQGVVPPGPGIVQDSDGTPVVYNPNNTLRVTPTTINDLRRAFRLQEWLEKAARGGSRYIEWIKVMFGVNSSDKRLQRPEYICGSKSPVVISEVLNTTGTVDAPQGNMAGHGLAVVNGNQDSYYCEEHGYIIGIMSIMPKPAYLQGIPRTFKKITDPTQYYFSTFANIGEQEVLNHEIYAYNQSTNSVFGYIPRYAEYRFMENRVAGDFRTTYKYWHQARYFGNVPQLNQTFVECVPDHRIFAVDDPDVQTMYCQVYNKVMSTRPIPKYGTPTF